ncbi:hypothetical protein [Thalassoroseus pseudoceratinae]|uniref:hypothetical protein n=1 Tax=Thalassoroseus pseudoceratinae TaxID=2713176 RepID=UPI001420C7DE|nr:hypothetical protein [Thalassoroseus pseudoceratinae]
MLSRFVTTILPVVGILLCPFACMGTGLVTECAPVISGSVCCGGGNATSKQAHGFSENHECPDFPDHDDCRHECVKNARLNTSTRTLLLKLDATFLTDAGLIVDQFSVAFNSATLGPHGRNATHPDLPSGIAVRVAIASWLV